MERNLVSTRSSQKTPSLIQASFVQSPSNPDEPTKFDSDPTQPLPAQSIPAQRNIEERNIEAGSMSLEALQSLAASRNPTLQQAYAQVQQARGNWVQVGLYPNPSVVAERAPNNAPFDMFNVYVKQDVVTARKLKLNRAVASYDVQRAQWDAEVQNLRVLNEVQIRYIAALGAQQQVTVLEELLKIAQQGVQISEQLLEGEQVSEADVMQARLQRSQTQILLRNAEFRRTSTWKQLGNIIGWQDLPVCPLEGRLEDEVPELEWDLSWQQLIGGSPLLNSARSRAAAAAMQVRREEVQPTPNIQVTSGLGRDYFSPEYNMYTLQFGFVLPTWNRNLGNIAASIGELHSSQSEVNRIELSLRNGLTATFQRYQSARNQVRTYHDSILPTAEENLSLTVKQYEQGEFDFLRVLTARRDLFEAKIEYVKSLVELRTAVIEIQGMLLTGGLDPVNSNPTVSNHAGETNGPGK